MQGLIDNIAPAIPHITNTGNTKTTTRVTTLQDDQALDIITIIVTINIFLPFVEQVVLIEVNHQASGALGTAKIAQDQDLRMQTIDDHLVVIALEVL